MEQYKVYGRDRFGRFATQIVSASSQEQAMQQSDLFHVYRVRVISEEMIDASATLSTSILADLCAMFDAIAAYFAPVAVKAWDRVSSYALGLGICLAFVAYATLCIFNTLRHF